MSLASSLTVEIPIFFYKMFYIENRVN